MLAPKRKRLFLFFLIAILLPAAALIFFAWQLVRQDSELASSRAAQERLTGAVWCGPKNVVRTLTNSTGRLRFAYP